MNRRKLLISRRSFILSFAAIAARLFDIGLNQNFTKIRNIYDLQGGKRIKVSAFKDISIISVSNEVVSIETCGYIKKGIGSANYTYDPVIDEVHVKENPKTSSMTLNGRGYRLQEEFVRIEQFGAMGDGVTNDDAAFAAFSAWALMQPKEKKIILHLAKGKVYCYTNPRWTQKIRNLVVYGNGARLHNIGVNGQDSIFGIISADVTSYNKDGKNIDVDRYRIATTSVGDTSVTCLNSMDAANFYVGQYLLVASFDQQFTGFPFNARYFEYAKVIASEPASGVISIDRQIKYEHRQDFPYNKNYRNGDGRASVYSIDQNGNVFDIDHEYRDMEFSFTNMQSYNCVVISGRKVVLYNVVCNWILRTQGIYIETNNCRTSGGEIDKLLSSCISNSDEFLGMVRSGTGVENMVFNSPVFHKGWRLDSKKLTVINGADMAKSAARSSIQTGVGFCETLNILGGEMNYPPTYTRGLTQEGGGYLTLGSRGVVWDRIEKAIIVNLISSGQEAVIFASMCFTGQIVRVREGEGLGLRGYNFGRVSRNVGDGSGVYSKIYVDFYEEMQGGERLIIDSEPFSAFLSTKIVSTDRKITQDYVLCPRHKFSLNNMQLVSNSTTVYPVIGVLKRICVKVLRPYTGGAGGSSTLTIKPSHSSAFLVVIDLRTAGTREASVVTHSGFSGSNGESFVGRFSNDYRREFFSDLVVLTSDLSGEVDEMPIVDISLEIFDPARERYREVHEANGVK